jgi:DNA-directed RNA polymerase beta' subunit
MKVIDYSTRGVISAAPMNVNSWKNQLVPFGYTGVPLSHAINLFYPFVIIEFKKLVEWYIKEYASSILKKKYKLTDEDIQDLAGFFTIEKIKKILNEYIKSPGTRFRHIITKIKTGDEVVFSFKNIDGKPKNLTEILYIVTCKVIDNKHVLVKRYPVENHQSIYPSKIKVLTTRKTMERTIDDYFYENYPDVKYHKNNVENAFIDTIILNTSYLGALGGDYDGQISLKFI